MANILESFKQFNLDPRESEILIFLANSPYSSAHHIAQTIHLPKTTVYDLIEQLIAKGFVSITIGSRGKTYSLNEKPLHKQ